MAGGDGSVYVLSQTVRLFTRFGTAPKNTPAAIFFAKSVVFTSCHTPLPCRTLCCSPCSQSCVYTCYPVASCFGSVKETEERRTS